MSKTIEVPVKEFTELLDMNDNLRKSLEDAKNHVEDLLDEVACLEVEKKNQALEIAHLLDVIKNLQLALDDQASQLAVHARPISTGELTRLRNCLSDIDKETAAQPQKFPGKPPHNNKPAMHKAGPPKKITPPKQKGEMYEVEPQKVHRMPAKNTFHDRKQALERVVSSEQTAKDNVTIRVNTGQKSAEGSKRYIPRRAEKETDGEYFIRLKTFAREAGLTKNYSNKSELVGELILKHGLQYEEEIRF